MFDIESYKTDVDVCCTTMEECKAFLRHLEEKVYRWNEGQSPTSRIYFVESDPFIVYRCRSTIRRISFDKDKIPEGCLHFSDFYEDEGDEAGSNDELFSYLCSLISE